LGRLPKVVKVTCSSPSGGRKTIYPARSKKEGKGDDFSLKDVFERKDERAPTWRATNRATLRREL